MREDRGRAVVLRARRAARVGNVNSHSRDLVFSRMSTPDLPANSGQCRPVREATTLGTLRAIDATAHHSVRRIANGGCAECPKPRVDDKVESETGSPYPPGIAAQIYRLKPGGDDLGLEEPFFHGRRSGDILASLVPAEESHCGPWHSTPEKQKPSKHGWVVYRMADGIPWGELPPLLAPRGEKRKAAELAQTSKGARLVKSLLSILLL